MSEAARSLCPVDGTALGAGVQQWLEETLSDSSHSLKVPVNPMRAFSLLLCLALLVSPAIASKIDHASQIATLIDPAKLATLAERGANSHVQKAVYWLAVARQSGEKPIQVLDRAVIIAGYRKEAAVLTRNALLRNLDIADKLGCLNEAGLGEMRRGKAATVMRGPYRGDQLSVDHIVPRTVVPELDNVIANLEFMPLRMNKRKNDKVGSRQRDLAKRFYQAGLLSRKGLETVIGPARNPR